MIFHGNSTYCKQDISNDLYGFLGYYNAANNITVYININDTLNNAIH